MNAARSLRPDDAAQVCALFEEAFKGGMTPAMLAWKYERDQLGISQVLEDENGVYGFCGFREHPFLIEGEPGLVMDGADHMIASARRSAGAWQSLLGASITKATEVPMPLGYGFPSPYLSQLGPAATAMGSLGPVQYVVREELDPPSVLPDDVTISSQPPADWDDHWPLVAPAHRTWLVRDAAYLDWRYVRRPDRHYEFVWMPERHALAVVGFSDGTSHLMELLAPPGDRAVLARLALAVEVVAGKQGATRIDAWFPAWSDASRVLVGGSGWTAHEAHHVVVTQVGAGFDIDEERLQTELFYSLGDWDVE